MNFTNQNRQELALLVTEPMDRFHQKKMVSISAWVLAKNASGLGGLG
jgi:hypothetical protein